MAEPRKLQVAVHPLLEKLKPSESVIELSGYVGPSSDQGTIRLYHSLHDLSHYIEFDQASVMQTAPADKNIAPNDGITLWVKSSTPIRWTREYRTANQLVNKVVSMGQSGIGSPPGVF